MTEKRQFTALEAQAVTVDLINKLVDTNAKILNAESEDHKEVIKNNIALITLMQKQLLSFIPKED